MSFDLNPGQRSVVETLDGRVLVSAGAGTGKTRALTERFVGAVSPDADGRRCADVDEILTITFTEKAAGEIAERIRTELRRRALREEAERLEGAWISTIHGFGRRLLRRHALEAGIDPGFSVADEVIGGFLADEAMEHAIARGLEGSAEVSAFLEAYGVSEAIIAAKTVADELRRRGLGVEDLITEPALPAGRLLSEARDVIARAEEGFRPHAAGSAGAQGTYDACLTAGVALREIDPVARDDEEAARAVWEAMTTAWPRRAGAAAVAEVAADLAEGRSRIALQAARIILQPLLGGLRELVARYLDERERLKEERGLLDFEDLQLESLRLLKENATLAEKYRRVFRLVMVDEFQDTDEVQLELIETVSGENLCTVGDERQSIYGFRGADVEVYRRHREKMVGEGAVPADLVENYRSHPDIIGFVNTLFGDPELFGPQLPGLVASAQATGAWPLDGPRVSFDVFHASGTRVESDRAEADALAERFARLRDAGVEPGDMVVLVRAYAKATPVADALRRRGIDAEIVGGSRFFELPEVSALLSFCEVVANPLDERALALLMISDMSALSDEGAALLALSRSEEGRTGPLWEALGNAEAVLSGPDLVAAQELRALVERSLSRIASGSLARAIAIAVEESGLDLLATADPAEGARAFANIQKLIRKVESFERSGGAGAAAFAARMRAEMRYGSTESPARALGVDTSAVRIMSIHASKGLEFPVVGIPFTAHPLRAGRASVRTRASGGALEAALALPKELKDAAPRTFADRTEWFAEMCEEDKAAETAEAKRQFYVACTRARDMLVLTGTVKDGKHADEMEESPLAWSARVISALGDPPVQGTTTCVRESGGSMEIVVRVLSADVPDDHRSSAPAAGGSRHEGGGATDAGPERSAEPRSQTELRRYEPAPSASAPPPTRLSATDIALYERCALRYWGERVARFGEAEEAHAGDPRVFGSALHALLQLDRPGEEYPGADRVSRVARFHGLEDSSAERLSEVLQVWYDSGSRRELHACERVWTEYPFVLEVGGGASGTFELSGAIDAWGRTGTHGLVVDYKTGAGGESEGELRDRYSDQASVYAHALLAQGLETVDVSFVRPEVCRPDGSIQEVRFRFAQTDRDRIEAWLTAVRGRIATQPYLPLEQWHHETCPSCRIAGSVCPLTPPRRRRGSA